MIWSIPVLVFVSKMEMPTISKYIWCTESSLLFAYIYVVEVFYTLYLVLMKKIAFASVFSLCVIIGFTNQANASYVDWDCQSRDALTQMNSFIDEKTTSLNEVKLARINYKQNEIEQLKWELEKILSQNDFYVNVWTDKANELNFYVSRSATSNVSGSNLERANQLISEITTKVANQPKWSFDIVSYNNRVAIRDTCVKKFADIDKQRATELEIQQKSEESNRLQEVERVKINAADQKEQEEAAIRALTKKKLELELEVLVKQKIEQASGTWAIQWASIMPLSSSSSWVIKNVDDIISEFQLLKTTREKNSFIGKRTVALKRELRKADKARVKEIINEMRDLKKLQK